MIFTAGPDGGRAYHNRWWCEFTGFPLEVAAGAGWAEALHPEDRERALARWAEAVRRPGPWESRHRLRSRDGSYRWVLARAVPVSGPSGEALGWTGVVLEIDESVRALDALRESEERFARFMRHLPGLAWIKDLEGRYIYANEAAEKAFGTPRDELYGRTDTEVFPPETAARFGENDRRALASEGGILTTEILEQEDGIRHSSLVSKFWIPGPDGRPGMVGGVAFDITELEQAQEALRASEARLRVTAEAVPGILFTATPDGQLDYLNRHFHELTGVPVESAKGRGWLETLHPDDLTRVERRWTAALRTRGAYEARQRIRARDGSYRWMLARALPVLDGTGEVVKWIGVAIDVDDSVRAEEALKSADRRKNEFLATLSHELRNPLAPLRSGLELLRLASADGEARERVRQMMERQVGQMVRLIDDLLDISRVTTGKIALRKERVELAAVVDAAVEATRPEMEASGHALTVSLPPGPIRLEADPMRLAQVLHNLLSNAVKFTEPGGRIRLSATREGGEVVLRVRDTGVGIAPEALPRIFEMFEQAHPSRESSARSLGIGLSLVRALVELHGGRVEALSQGTGRGSEFVVRLPLPGEDAGRSEPRPQKPAAVEGLGEAAAAEGSREATPARRVLVVDDNRDAAESLAVLLSLMGHETRTAYDGPGGLEAAAGFRPDVALLDLGLPGMSGYEMARAMRVTPGLEGVVLIAVTGWGEEAARLRSREAGFRHHLVKPVDIPELKRLLTSPDPGPPDSPEPAGRPDQASSPSPGSSG